MYWNYNFRRSTRFSPLLATDTNNAQFKGRLRYNKKIFGHTKAKGCWLPGMCLQTGLWIYGKDGKKNGAPQLKLPFKITTLSTSLRNLHVIEGGNSIGNRRTIGFTELNISASKKKRRDMTPTAHIGFPMRRVAVMGRNDRAGFQVWSAADGYPGDGCYRIPQKGPNSGITTGELLHPIQFGG